MLFSKKLITIGLFMASCTVFAGSAIAQNTSNASANIERDVSLFKKANPNINEKALESGLKAYYSAREKGLGHHGIFTLINYHKPSSEKRLWVLDMKNHKILFNELVAHGKNSGGLNAEHFSNRPQSRETSLGLFLTENTYFGKHGLSLRLKGLSKGLNTNAYRRSVVIHGAHYVSDSFVKAHGRLGRSWGCPALSMKMYKPTINTIKNGTLVYAYYPTSKLLDNHNLI